MAAILTTERLMLRELTYDDLDFVAVMLADPDVMRYWPRPQSRDESLGWIERQIARYAQHGCGYWLIIDRKTSRPVGQAGVMIIELAGVEQSALGWIIHAPFWRRGYAMESARACIGFAFNRFNRPSVNALIRPENHPSIALAKKLGMKRIGQTMHADLVHEIYSLSRTPTC